MLTDIELKYPSNILFLILAIAAVVFFILAFGKKEKIMAMLHLGYKTRFKVLRTALLGVGLCLMVFALMGPQVFAGYAEVSKTGLDIYVLMDTSKSMLVSDIMPDRMTIAKKIAGNLLDQLEGDRIGFIPFASDAYIQMPLTDDYQLARMFLNVMDTDMIGGGTNLAAAIKLANSSFERTSGADRVILILSDGEEHDESGLAVLKSIRDDQVKIYTVGIGTEKGGLIPVYNDAGDTIIDYIKDVNGNPVTSRLNADTLKQLAQDGHGSYYQATLQGAEISSLLGDLSVLKKDDYQMEKIKKFNPLYQYFLGLGVLLFMIAWFLPERRKEDSSLKKILCISGIITGLLLSLLLTGWVDAEDKVKKALQQGNEQYVSAKYEEALKSYEIGLAAKPENKTLNFNAAQAAHLLGEYEKAAQYYENAVDCTDKYLNAGNIFFRMGDAAQDENRKAQCYAQALQIYKEGIIKYPQDVSLKYNYEFVKKKVDELLEEMEMDSEDESGDQSNEQSEYENSTQNDSQSDSDESQASQDQESEDVENTQDEQNENSEQDENSGEIQDEGQEGDDKQQEEYSQDEEEYDLDQEAIERILEMLESQEEESLKNNQGVVVGKDEANVW